MSQQLCETVRITVSSLSEIPKKRKESAKSVQCDNGCAAKLRTRPQWHVEALNKQEECINGYSLLCQRYIMQPKTVLLVSFTFSIRLLEQLY